MMNLYKRAALVIGVIFGLSLVAPAIAAEMMEKPSGFPERPLTMIVPYGPAGGSGQVSRAMIQGVKDAADVDVTP